MGKSSWNKKLAFYTKQRDISGLAAELMVSAKARVQQCEALNLKYSSPQYARIFSKLSDFLLKLDI